MTTGPDTYRARLAKIKSHLTAFYSARGESDPEGMAEAHLAACRTAKHSVQRKIRTDVSRPTLPAAPQGPGDGVRSPA